LIDLQQLTEEKNLCFLGVLFVFWGFRGGIILFLSLSKYYYLVNKWNEGRTNGGQKERTEDRTRTQGQTDRETDNQPTQQSEPPPKNPKKSDWKFSKQHPTPQKNF